MDRRFNRRAYDARRVIEAALAAEEAGIDVEAVLRDALRDPDADGRLPGTGRRLGACGRAAGRHRGHTSTWTGTAGWWPGSASTRTARTQRPCAGPPRWPPPSSTTPRLRAELAQQVRRDRRVPGPAGHRPAPGTAPDRAGPARRRPAVGCSRWPSSSSPRSSTATRSGCAGARRRRGRRRAGRGPRAARPGERPAPGGAGRRRAGRRARRHGPALPRAAARPGRGRPARPGHRVHGVVGDRRGRRQRPEARRAPHGIEVDVRPAATATCGCGCTTTATAAPTRTDPGCAGCATGSRRRDGRLTRHQRRRRNHGRGGAAVRVVIADDSGLLRDGLANLLTEAGVDVVAPGRRRRAAHRHGRRARTRRRRRRHPDAADVHPRGRQGRPRAARSGTPGWASCCSPSRWRAATSPTWPGPTPAASATCSRTG